MITESDYLKFLVASGAPVLWCAPVLDSDGQWLSEVDGEGTGTSGSGYWLPRHKDPVVREKHRIREPAEVDYFLAKEPRPAFILLTGHVFDVVDIDVRAADAIHEPIQEAAYARMVEAVSAPIADIDTPSGGTHLLVPTDEALHSTSNVHSRVDYRGKGGIAWLPGTIKRGGGMYVVRSHNPSASGTHAAIAELLSEWRQDFKDCEHCKKAQQEKATRLYSGMRLGDGAGWDAIEEDLPTVDWQDPLTDTSPQAIAQATLTWRALLSPWFDVVGVKDNEVWLIRAGKVAEGRQGKSAILYLDDNRVVVYSSDWPIATGVQLSKLDVHAAIKEFESPGPDAPTDFVENMRYLRDRWAGEVCASVGVAIPAQLRTKAANPAALPIDFPILPDEFWEAHPLLKRIYSDADMRRASPEGVLSSIMAYTISHIGHQVRIPGQFSDEARAGATLNMGQIKVGEPGAGKGQGERIAALFLEPYTMKKFASGQAFPKAYGKTVRPKKPTQAELLADPLLDPDPQPYYERTNWSVYTEYSELDEFKAQAASDTSTLSSILRDVTTSDVLSERVAVSEQSNSGQVVGFRFCFTAHAQPLKLEWLIDQSSNGFPQRFWWVWSKPRPKSREELLALPRVAPPIEPIQLMLPHEWHMQQEGDADKPFVLVSLPECATEDIILWEYDCPEDDIRGMLCVRLKAYVALKALLPDLDECDVWTLATQFHEYSRTVRRHVENMLREEKLKANAVMRTMAKETAVAVTEATESKRQHLLYAKCRARVAALFSEAPAWKRRDLARRLSSAQCEALEEVLDDLVVEGTLIREDGSFRIA